MEKVGKYAKIVIISTLDEPRSLVEISTDWFLNKGRLYQPSMMKEIKKAIKEGWLIQINKRQYRANIKKILKVLLEDVSEGKKDRLSRKYKDKLLHFYITLGEFTQKVYLNYEIIKVLTKLDHKKAESLDLPFLFQLPFLLRSIEENNEGLANFIISLMNLEKYMQTIDKLELQHHHLLKKDKRLLFDWVDTFDNLLKILPKLHKKGWMIYRRKAEMMKELGG